MNADEKKILELLKKNRAMEAPEDFTINVMNSIIDLEENKKSVFQFNSLTAGLFMFTAVLASIAVFYYFDNTFFEDIISQMVFVSDILNNQFSWINTYLVQMSSLLKQNVFALGLIFSVFALLSFDKLFLKRKVNMNLLSVV